MLSPTASSYNMAQLARSTEYTVQLQAISTAERSRHATAVFSTGKDQDFTTAVPKCRQSCNLRGKPRRTAPKVSNLFDFVLFALFFFLLVFSGPVAQLPQRLRSDLPEWGAHNWRV